MRILSVTCLLLLAAPSIALGQNESADRAVWGEWARAFSTYAAQPTSSHADALLSALVASRQNGTRATPPTYDSIGTWIDALERQVVARDPVAVHLAFAIEPYMGNGEISESIDIMLGKLIRIDPKLFLTALRDQERRQARVSMPGANLGPELVDEFAAQCKELRLRVHALEGVADSTLADVKHRAIANLNESARGACNN